MENGAELLTNVVDNVVDTLADAVSKGNGHCSFKKSAMMHAPHCFDVT